MTPSRKAREAVLERWPEAYQFHLGPGFPWRIYDGIDSCNAIGTGPTRAAAWQDAAKRLEGEGK